MKFRFAYERLLEHRKMREDLAKKDWAVAVQNVRKTEAFIQDLELAIQRTHQAVGDWSAQSSFNALGLVGCDEFINGTKQKIAVKKSELKALRGEEERLHEILVELAKDRRTLERLKEKRREEFKKIEKKREIKFMDELAVLRHQRTER